MRDLRSLLDTLWEWLSRDTPRLFIEVGTWLAGETWTQFAIRLTCVLFALFVVRSLWNRLADIGDNNPIVTIGGFAALMALLLAGLGAYYAGLWREVAPRWLP